MLNSYSEIVNVRWGGKGAGLTGGHVKGACVHGVSFFQLFPVSKESIPRTSPRKPVNLFIEAEDKQLSPIAPHVKPPDGDFL